MERLTFCDKVFGGKQVGRKLRWRAGEIDMPAENSRMKGKQLFKKHDRVPGSGRALRRQRMVYPRSERRPALKIRVAGEGLGDKSPIMQGPVGLDIGSLHLSEAQKEISKGC